MIVLLAFAGASVLMYPTAGNWFSDRAHAAEITGYIATVDSMPTAERAAEIDRARQYNASLVRGRLSDPYSTPGGDDESAEYLDQLSTSPTGTMARIVIPALGIALPVYHGTSTEALSRGIGHLQGSALPVGGPSTNSVLTGHSGVPQASLFTDLHKAEVGDLVYIETMGETFTYRMTIIETVLPSETDLLQPVVDKDLITLITCTPIGVNSHRIVIRAERVDETEDTTPTVVGGTAGPGFPWWALALGTAFVSCGAHLARP